MTSPMTKEQVLAVLDEYIEHFTGYRPFTDDPRLQECIRTRSAVAALYERCEALERALQERNQGTWVWGKRYPLTSFTNGTEASDAEGAT